MSGNIVTWPSQKKIGDWNKIVDRNQFMKGHLL
jgi:hypothetical protein